MFIITQGVWVSGTYIAESVARSVAEARSGVHPEEPVIMWTVSDGKRVFAARYENGTRGAERHHPRPDQTFNEPPPPAAD